MSVHPLTVLESFPAPRPTSVNPYTLLLADSIRAEGVELLYFSWRTALTARYDLFHVHWPEILVEGRTPLRRIVRQALTLALVTRLRITRRPIVRTVHNLGLPSGLSTTQRRLLEHIDRHTTLRVRLNEHTPMPVGAAHATIPHANFRGWFAQYPKATAIAGQVGYLGRIRRYKGVEALIAAFVATRARETVGAGSSVVELSLRIAGYASTPELAAALTDLTVGDPRISIEFGFVSDEAIAELVTTSELVVLPYRVMHNSSAAITALSLDRPILVPHNPVTNDLSYEVGAGWVHTFHGELSARDIRAALESNRATPPAAPPRLEARNWKHSGRAHVDAFRRAVALSRAHASSHAHASSRAKRSTRS